MQIEDTEVTIEKNYLDPVTYLPAHVNGNAGHKDCQQGVIIKLSEKLAFVLYCDTRTVQGTNPDDLVWG